MLVSVLADADAMGALDSADPGPVWQVVGQAWRKALGEDLPWRTEPPTPAAWRVWAALLGACAVALLQRAGLAVFEAAEVLQLPRRETGPAARTTLLLPVMPGRAD
ncbi:MAG TPA: cyanophycin synthetase, partial [Thauera aminoaromatica]|nr:cyanophycin synthetase [Thauera aminoaromatica]